LSLSWARLSYNMHVKLPYYLAWLRLKLPIIVRVLQIT
jgi:hypothetical protein